jgi:hypothetical protein
MEKPEQEVENLNNRGTCADILSSTQCWYQKAEDKQRKHQMDNNGDSIGPH